MAFLGIFLMFLAGIILVLAFTTFLSIVNFIIYFIIRKKSSKKKKIFFILGWIFLSPLILLIALLIYATIDSAIYHNTSLTYNVMTNNYEKVEEMLEDGADPDVSVFTDKAATDGEMTNLSCLAQYGFVDTLTLRENEDSRYVDPLDDQNQEDINKMVELLIKYGADVDYASDSNDGSSHKAEKESDYYLEDDGCGRTPFLWAVGNNDIELAKILVENGADVNAKDACGFGAIQIIADTSGGLEATGTDMLKYVVKEGATVGSATNYGQDLGFLVYRRNENENDCNEFFRIIGSN